MRGFLDVPRGTSYPANMALTPAQRLELGLDDPAMVVSEFGAPPQGTTQIGGLVPRTSTNLKLVLQTGEKASAPKIRNMIQELLAGNMDNANYWLQQVGAANPKVGVELFIELCQFSLPKLRATAIAVQDTGDRGPRALSFEDLQKTLYGDD